jgi:hydroxymethylglutaryl-CoA lyase
VSGGNVCTEDLLHLWHRLGLRREIALEPIVEVAKAAAALLGRDLPGRVHKTGAIPGGVPISA